MSEKQKLIEGMCKLHKLWKSNTTPNSLKKSIAKEYQRMEQRLKELEAMETK